MPSRVDVDVSSTFKRLGQSELLPRYIFAESLYARRRVLEIGAVASTLGQSARFLSTRGARIVVAADSDLAAVQEAQQRYSGPNLRYRPSVFDDFESGSFDLVIVSDLAAYVRAPELLKELARLVTKAGYLMGGLRNPAGLALSNVLEADDSEAPPTYGQLLDALTSHFNSIEVATQSPFLGYQIAFEKGEGLQVDGSLAGLSEAAYYVVLAGHEPVRNFDPTWVQLPPEPLAFTGGKLEDATHRARDWHDRSERLKEALTKKTAELHNRESALKEAREELEAAKNAVSRLTAQLESSRERPEVLRDREDLAARISTLDAELTVARERAIDAEGRVTASRAEFEAVQRSQKDSVITALASQEEARLERARREEVVTQLEDARLRLVKTHEELRRSHEVASTDRVELERARLAVDRAKADLASKERELAEARDRELRLADARTEALKAIEHLERGFADVRAQLGEAREAVEKKETDRLSAVRSLELEAQTRQSIVAELERERARALALSEELTHRVAQLSGVETELEALTAAHARTLRDVETLSNSERNWRELATQFEQRLAGTASDVQQLSEQLAQAEAAREAEIARARRLELDLSTAIGSERSARAQTEAALVDAQARLVELTDDRDALLARRDELAQVVGDLERVRAGDVARVQELLAEVDRLTTQLGRAEAQAAEARRELAFLRANAIGQERALRLALDEREKSLEFERAALAAVTAERESLTQGNRDLDERLATLGETLFGVRRELEAATSRATALATQLEQVSADHTAATAREREVEERRSLLELAHLDLEKRHRVLESDARLVSERASELEQTLLAAQAQLREAESDAKATQAELGASLDVALGRASALESELAALREAHEALRREATAERAALEGEVAALRGAHEAVQREAAAERAAFELQLDERQITLELAQAEAQSLQARTAELEAALDGERGRATSLADEAQALKASVATLEAERQQVRGLLDGQGQQTSALQAELAARESTIATLEQTVAERTRALERHAADLADLHARVSKVDLERHTLAESLAAAMSEAEHVRAELAEAIEGRLAEGELSGRLRQELDAAVDQLAVLRAEFEVNQTALLGARANLELLETSRAGLTASLQTRTAELEAAKEFSGRALLNKQAELDDKHGELEATRRSSARALDDKHAELEEARQLAARALEEKQAELEATKQAATRALDDQHAELEAALGAERARLQIELDQQAAAYRDALDQHRTDAERARTTLEQTHEAAITSKDRALADAQRQSIVAERELQRSRELSEQQRQANRIQIDLLHKQVGELRAAADRAQADGRASLAARADLQREVDTLREELNSMRASLAQVGGESRAMASARAQLEGELVRLRQRVPSLEGDLETLKARHLELESAAARARTLEVELNGTRQTLATHEASAAKTRQQLVEVEVALAQARSTATDAEARAQDARAERSSLEGELVRLRDRLSMADVEATRLREAHASSAPELLEMRKRVALLDAQLAEAGRPGPASDDEVAQLRRRLPELEAELEIARVNARNEVETAKTARAQVEDLLLALRVKYGDLQHSVTSLPDDLHAARAENDLLEQERERVARQLEEVPRLNTRIALLQAELELQKQQLSPLVPPLTDSQPSLDRVTTPVAVPATDVEVFDLDIENTPSGEDAEEIVLLDEEATDPGVKKKKR